MEEIKKIKNIKALIPKVYNVFGNSEKEIANQFEIVGEDEKGNSWILFQSYRSPIALKYKGEIYIFKDWDYSVTTGKYRNKFLRETKKETLVKIKNKEYIAVDFDISYLN